MVFSFTGTIAHFIDEDWNPVECLMDFHHMGDKEHAGALCCESFCEVSSGSRQTQKDKLYPPQTNYLNS
jgi:hypothetical protein